MFSRKPAVATVPLKSDPSIRRSYLSPDKLLQVPFGDDVQIVGDIILYCAKVYGSRRAASYRTVVDIVEEIKPVKRDDGTEEEKSWKYFTLSPPVHQSYNDLATSLQHLISSFHNIGFTSASTPIADRSRVSIYADTSLHWQLISQTCARLGHTITTAYTTLGEEGLLTSLVEPDVEMVYCGEEQVELIAKVIERATRVKWVVWDGDDSRVRKTDLDLINQIVTSRGGKIIHYDELISLGQDKPVKLADTGPKPTPDDLFAIMYTSGSTGPPKGVLLTNRNVIAGVTGAIELWRNAFDYRKDTLLSYLPLTHILEQYMEFTFLLHGIPLAFARVKTLLDDSVRNCQGDFTAYKPTLFAGVPGIFEMIRKGMMKKISDAPALVGTIFNLAVTGKQTLPWPLSAVIDKVLFARVKQATGGRLRLTVCGGGALSRETQLFMSTVLAPLIQGYGLTETVGMATICTTAFDAPGTVGALGPTTEAKLVDCPDLGYTSAHNPPQGEIWLRGDNVFIGYFKQEELTREAFSEDGWYKTGDIGQWNPDGTLSIIDRVKNLVKLQNGEYIALDRLESIYKACDDIMFLAITAPPQADRPVAVVYPHEGNLRHHLRQSADPSLADGNPHSWSTDPKVKAFILASLQAVGKRNNVAKAELIRDVVMTTDEWAPATGMLTPAMKLSRPFINKQYAKEIEAVFSSK